MTNVCLVAPIRLLVSWEQGAALERTLTRANEARSWIADRGMSEEVFGRTALHRLVYYDARARFGLSSQMTVRAIGSVVECFRRDRRRQPQFRPNASFPYDNRVLRSDRKSQSVSIWTLEGRQQIPFVAGKKQMALLDAAVRVGECDLRPLADGRWMLHVSVCVEAPRPYEPRGWLGVDLGIVTIAADSDGMRAAGGHLNALRRRHRRVRQRLQVKDTRSARRRLRLRAGRESRFATDVNHRIAKELVRRAQRTGRGIALEELSGIRERIRASRPQRGVLHSWAFRQLQEFIAYKARIAGVPVRIVDPRHTSQQCPRCGHVDRRNRPSRGRFRCVRCRQSGDANVIAARNIARRADVSRPIVPSGVDVSTSSKGKVPVTPGVDNGEVRGHRVAEFRNRP